MARTTQAQRRARASEALLPIVCTVIMRIRHYTTLQPSVIEACVAYESQGENVTDAQLFLLRTQKVTAAEMIQAQIEYPEECQY
jgi:cobyric acid synthase